ncbi:TIGR03545 family protein [Spongiibacter sp.]|uniref:TIGR03545 family protein n=1 Tax=Spongiibacter sp. TaxID=2024860 RepID=UPI0035627E9A
MMKWILRGLLILAAIIIATVVFALEPIAKWVIESEGSKAVGARVDVASVDITLYPTHLALHGLTVANPNEAMRNLLESETVSANIDSKALLKRQFITEQVLLSGLQMATPRTTPGTLDGSMPPPKDDTDSGLPSITLPDASAMLAEEQAIIQAEVAEIESGFEALQSKWQQKSNTLPKQERLAEFKQRWAELKNKNTFERLAGAKQLRDDIKDELKQFKGLNRELSADTETAKALGARAAKLPASQSQRILSKYGVDQGAEGMLRMLLGDDASQFVQRGLTLYKQTIGELAAKEPAASAPETASELPVSILIKEIKIDGYQMLGQQKLAYNGRITDVTDQLIKPITMKLQGGIEQQAQLLIDGLFKQQGEDLKADLSMTLKQLLLAGVSLSQSPQLPLQLENGLADIAANFSMEGDNLSGSVKGLVNQAKLLVVGASEQNTTAQRLARALKGVSKLVMDMRVNGSVDNPIVKLKSNLDSILGDVLGEEVKARLKELEGELKTDIQSQYGEQLGSLQQKRELLASYKELLGDREAAFQALLTEPL